MEWSCNRCGHRLGPAGGNYKHGCLVSARDPREIWRPVLDGPRTLSYDPEWARLVEFYCPGCGTLVETELLPPGHPTTYDIEISPEQLRAWAAEGAEP
jgi:acetophenone carboxylase